MRSSIQGSSVAPTMIQSTVDRSVSERRRTSRIDPLGKPSTIFQRHKRSSFTAARMRPSSTTAAPLSAPVPKPSVFMTNALHSFLLSELRRLGHDPATDTPELAGREERWFPYG